MASVRQRAGILGELGWGLQMSEAGKVKPHDRQCSLVWLLLDSDLIEEVEEEHDATNHPRTTHFFRPTVFDLSGGNGRKFHRIIGACLKRTKKLGRNLTFFISRY
jgi:hypothetical protein